MSEALEHWRLVEAVAGEGGISFVEGMRLLAGAPADLGGDNAADDDERKYSLVNAGAWLSELLAGLRTPDGLVPGGHSKSFCGTLRD